MLQINTTVNSGSTGRIAEDIGNVLLQNGHESYIAYGRGNRPSKSKLIKIGNEMDVFLHGIKTAISDRHGFGSNKATRELIAKIKLLKPDIISLHNLHGYYINIELLFNYLKTSKIPVCWTLFDCWAFTGHCTYFDNIDCQKWVSGCYSCPKTNKYPSSYLLDNSKKNYLDKERVFNSVDNLSLITNSTWLKNLVGRSFLKGKSCFRIPIGVNLEIFYPLEQAKLEQIRKEFNLTKKMVILGVASVWDVRKGLSDFIKLRTVLPSDFAIVLIGLNDKQVKNLPVGIIGIKRTENVNELAAWYSLASVFVNPTYLDNFPTTNLESLACGTPVITYDTGGSPEAINENTGFVVKKGDIQGLKTFIETVISGNKGLYSFECRKRAEALFNYEERFKDYLAIFDSIIAKSRIFQRT